MSHRFWRQKQKKKMPWIVKTDQSCFFPLFLLFQNIEQSKTVKANYVLMQ